MKLTRKSIFACITFAWAFFVALAWTHQNFFELLNVGGFVTLIITPGLLTVLGLGDGGQRMPYWYRFGQLIGWSVLEIISFLLLCNTVLPHLHVTRPLDRQPLIIELSILCFCLGVWSWRRLRNSSFQVSLRAIYKTRLDAVLVLLPLLFVGLSILGAIRLNDGGNALITLFMLIGMGVYMAIMFRYRRRLHDNTFAWALYAMGLSLLLMTSLRSWYTTGHDVELEYRVFQITKQAGVWNIAAFRNPFNACLSITILPTVFANLLHVPDPYIYKVYFQLLFASVPAIIYLFMRQYLTKGKAFLAVIYFIAFPTFFTDMCMLNRQEIAFLFLALMLMIVFNKNLALRSRQLLFMVFGMGMVLSHYSTTYSVIFLLLLLAVMRPVFWWIAPRLKRWRLFRQTSIALPDGPSRSRHLIPLVAIVAVVLAGFMWNSVLTGTSTAGSVLHTTINNIDSGLEEDSRSNDVSYSLLSGGSTSPQQQLAAYLKTDVAVVRRQAPAGTFYPSSIVNHYPLTVAPEAYQPLTAIGRFLQRHHIAVRSLNAALKQTWARLLQVFVLLGLVYALFRQKLNKKFEPEFLLLSIACIVFLALQVLLPYISVAYGILRAFQQSLMIIGLFLVVGTYALTVRFKKAWLRHGIPAALAITFFFASTGVVSQLLGGYQAQLQLDNSGQYYDTYYLHKSEVTASVWLQQTLKQSGNGVNVQADLFTASRLTSLTGINAGQDITPGVVERDSYVMLGYTDVTKHQVTLSYNGNLVTYNYPIQFLNQTKNLIYDDGGAEIYR